MTTKPKLLDQMRQALRLKRFSYETEKAYVHWSKRFTFHFDNRHPYVMGKEEVEAFLVYLAVDQDDDLCHVLNKGPLGVRSPLDL
jgi:hypothetical protein